MLIGYPDIAAAVGDKNVPEQGYQIFSSLSVQLVVFSSKQSQFNAICLIVLRNI